MSCIAPVLAAKAIPGCEVTVGHPEGAMWPYAETCAGIGKAGAKHIIKDVTISFTVQKIQYLYLVSLCISQFQHICVYVVYLLPSVYL